MVAMSKWSRLLVAMGCCGMLATAPSFGQKAAPEKKPAKAPAKKAEPKKVYPSFTDEASAGPDWAAMGDYKGSLSRDGGGQSELIAQVLALGKGEFRANLLPAFDQRVEPLAVLTGKMQDGKVVLTGRSTQGEFADTGWTVCIDGGKLTGTFAGPAKGKFELARTVRTSPTMGAKPPKGAVVLFDGKNVDAWEGIGGKPVGWKLVDGAMEAVPKSGSIISRQKFVDQQVHVEFRSPFMPEATGQARGNSGVYLQGRYEVQVLDSYALSGEDNECGGIYKVSKPAVNMCFPPLVWQTYDITFHVAVIENDQVVKTPRITVVHNGVKIQDNVELPANVKGTTGAATKEDGLPGGLYLQDHGNPVQYRNIWIVELKK